MVCPPFLHGSSIENPQIDGQTMDEPWTNPLFNPFGFLLKNYFEMNYCPSLLPFFYEQIL
jgi:hypothetical protein